jgi:hypothetical protein
LGNKKYPSDLLKSLPGGIDFEEKGLKRDQNRSNKFFKKELESVEPFSVMVSRDQREKVLELKKSSSMGPMYKPKFAAVEK